MEITICSSSRIAPIRSTARISNTSSTSIISPLAIISGRSRLMISRISRSPPDSSNPMIRSASRIAETSGVVTTSARSAPATAFLNSLFNSCRTIQKDIIEFFPEIIGKLGSSVPEIRQFCPWSGQTEEDTVLNADDPGSVPVSGGSSH